MPGSTAPRGPVSVGDVHRALERVGAERARLAARLAEARDWELATMAGRGEVIERILRLIA